MEPRTALIVDVRPGEQLSLAGVTVELLSKSGQLARLRVTAPRDVRIEKLRAREAEPVTSVAT